MMFRQYSYHDQKTFQTRVWPMVVAQVRKDAHVKRVSFGEANSTWEWHRTLPLGQDTVSGEAPSITVGWPQSAQGEDFYLAYN